MGAGGDLSREAVHGIVAGLECSPSKHDTTGVHGGKPNIVPTAKRASSVVEGTHLPTHTSELQMRDRSAKLPNYKGQFAKRAQEV